MRPKHLALLHESRGAFECCRTAALATFFAPTAPAPTGLPWLAAASPGRASARHADTATVATPSLFFVAVLKAHTSFGQGGRCSLLRPPPRAVPGSRRLAGAPTTDGAHHSQPRHRL